MKPEIAKNIGIKKALKAATIGILIAYSIMVFFAGGDFLWPIEFNYIANILIGILILYVSAYFFWATGRV